MPVQVNCDDALAGQADWLGGLLKSIVDERGPGFLRDGVTIRFGWSMLKLLRRGDGLVVCEPDFSSDPFATFREDVTVTLRVQAEQNEILQLLEIEGKAVSYDQKIVLARGAAGARQIYLERKATDDPKDSGWFLGYRQAPPGPVEYEALYVFHLLDRRPSALQVLSLPDGYLAVMDGDDIESIVDEENTSPWGR